MDVKTCVCVVSSSARDDIVSILVCFRSMSMCPIVLIRGEGANCFFFFNRSFVSRAVQWTGRPQGVSCSVNVHHWLRVQLCVLTSSVVVCFFGVCCEQRTSTEHRSLRRMRIIFLTSMRLENASGPCRGTKIDKFVCEECWHMKGAQEMTASNILSNISLCHLTSGHQVRRDRGVGAVSRSIQRIR